MKTTIVCLCLLVAVAAASLVEDYQSYDLKVIKTVKHRNTVLMGYKYEGKFLLEPYVAFNVDSLQPIRKSVFDVDGYYALVPIHVTKKIKVSKKFRRYRVMSLRSFSVSLRCGFGSWCSKCQDVKVSAVSTRREFSVMLHCKQLSVCKRLLNALYHNTPDSKVVRNAFKFKFSIMVGNARFTLTKMGLPVYRATKLPLKNGVWFEGNKMIMYTLKANSGHNAYETFVRDMYYQMPVDGSWPDVYRSPLLNDLAKAIRTSSKWEIVAEMRTDDKMVAQLVFDVSKNRNSISSENWFSASRLKSSYPYGIPTSHFHFFSVAGDSQSGRRFFVNHATPQNCLLAHGFWGVYEKNFACPWLNQCFTKGPALVYNRVQGAKYTKDSVGCADQFIVYLRYNPELKPFVSPYRKEFEFEPKRLLLYTIMGKMDNSFHTTFVTPGNNYIPADGRLPSLYRSDLLDEMPTVSSSTGERFVVVEMRTAGVMVAQVKFNIVTNAAALSSLNWFDKSRLVSSYPYDIKPKTCNRFSLVGQRDNNVHRSLYINFDYIGCPYDHGFIVAVDKHDKCPWANRFWTGMAPNLLYNPTPGATWLAGAREAERLLIYLE